MLLFLVSGRAGCEADCQQNDTNYVITSPFFTDPFIIYILVLNVVNRSDFFFSPILKEKGTSYFWHNVQQCLSLYYGRAHIYIYNYTYIYMSNKNYYCEFENGSYSFFLLFCSGAST